MKATLAVGLISTLLMAQVVVQVGCSEPQTTKAVPPSLQSESKRRRHQPRSRRKPSRRSSRTETSRHQPGNRPHSWNRRRLRSARVSIPARVQRFATAGFLETSSFQLIRHRLSSSRAC